jgi:hypothetical protein
MGDREQGRKGKRQNRLKAVGRKLLVLTDFVVDKLGENLSGMEARKSATLWSDEQHRSRASFAIPWESPYLRAVCE